MSSLITLAAESAVLDPENVVNIFGDPVATSTVIYWVVGVLVLAAGAIFAVAMLSGRERKLDIRSAGSRALAPLWALPVIAVGALLVLQAVPALKDGPTRTPDDFEISRVDREDLIDRTAADDLPDWVRNADVSDSGEKVVLSSTQRATLEEAETQAYAKAAVLLKDRFHEKYPDNGDWTIPRETLKSSAVQVRRHDQKLDRETENFEYSVHQVHIQVDTSDAALAAIYPSYQKAVSRARVNVLGVLTAFVVLVVAAAAMYLRLDARTGGAARTRLKFAAVSLMTAAGLIAAVMMPRG